MSSCSRPLHYAPLLREIYRPILHYITPAYSWRASDLHLAIRGRGKNEPVLDCIAKCLSFIDAALHWIACNTEHPAPINPPQLPGDPDDPPAAAYIWEGTISDLIELSIAIHKLKLIRKSSGQLITYAEIVRTLQIIFDIKIPNIYSRKTRVAMFPLSWKN